MNPTDIASVVTTARREAERHVLRYGQRLSDMPKAEALLLRLAGLPSFADVQMVGICGDYTRDERTELDFFLKVPNSLFPREAVRLLGIRLAKTPSNDAITCKGEVDGMSLHIYGYLPTTCAIVYEEVDVPARRERRPKVVCAGNGEVA